MTKKYTIELTDEENLALGYAAFSQQEWIDNAVHERCRIAIDKISQITIEQCLQENIQIPGSKQEMTNLAFQKGWVKLAKDIEQEDD